MKKLVILPALAMFACIDVAKETGDMETGTAEPVVDTTPALNSASVTWGSSDVTLAFEASNVTTAGYWWGIAETDANSADVGSLSVARSLTAGQSSTTNGYTSGSNSPPVINVIDKYPFAADGTATDVGDLTVGRYSMTGQQV